MQGLGCSVFRVLGFGFRVGGSGFRVLGLRVLGSQFWVCSLGFGGYVLGCVGFSLGL